MQWERASVKVEGTYFRLKLQAVMLTVTDKISIAIDDVYIGPCKPGTDDITHI